MREEERKKGHSTTRQRESTDYRMIQKKRNSFIDLTGCILVHSILLEMIKKALRKTLDGKHVSSKSRVKYGQ